MHLSVQLNPTQHPVFHDVTLARLSFCENLFIGQGSSVSCMHQVVFILRELNWRKCKGFPQG